MAKPWIIVGAGLAGTLAALEAERRNLDFVVFDEHGGRNASRAAAGLFNPLTGPRFTPDGDGWDRLVPFYRNLEQRLGASLLHLLPLIRPWKGARIGPASFPQSAPGWTAVAQDEGVRIDGGGWVDVSALLDAARARGIQSGRWAGRFEPVDGIGRRVLWCGGLEDFLGPVWSTATAGLWQGVRGDVLTVRIPGLTMDHAEIGTRFLLPLGKELFRWGATHESDIVDLEFRPEARTLLEKELSDRLSGQPFEVVEHVWGVRPSSRTKAPLVMPHPDHPGWTLFNGFGGRGVALIPRWLDKIPF